LRTSTAFLSKNEFTDITRNRLTPLLSNNNLNSFKILIPKTAKYQISSIAIAPITMNGQIVGSYNPADLDIHRFEPVID
jgi:hypothetical protein